MRIAFNTLPMKQDLLGIGNYIKLLLHYLARIDRKNEYVLYVSKENFSHVEGLGSNFDYEFAPTNRPLRVWWEQMVLPRNLERRRVDVFHGPFMVTPLLKRCAYVTTIHDMCCFITPDRQPLAWGSYMRILIPQVARRADRIIAVSESTKRDIGQLLRIADDKITVIHHGVEDRFHPIEEGTYLEEVRKKYLLPDKFILFVGWVSPFKNLQTLIEAYKLVPQIKDEYGLVLAGSLQWRHPALFQQVKDSRLEKNVYFPGYVSDDDLPGLYNLASVVIQPSVYEGFGFPMLEAMACGKPVIAANTSSLPEIVGAAGLLIDPTDPKALANAIEEVLGNTQLQQSLSERGRRRARAFTWESTARNTLAVYEAVSSRR